MRRAPKQRSRRSRERSTSRASRAEPTARQRAFAPRLAKLLARERRHTQQLAAVRSRIDATLCGSTISEYKAIAHEVIIALGLDDTADELERVAAALKKRVSTARRRCRVVTAGHREVVAEQAREAQDGGMTNDPFLRRRIIEEYGPPPDGDLGDPEDLNGDFEDDDEDEDPADHNLGDSGDPRGPGPR